MSSGTIHQSAVIDGIKALGAQIIVLHHLVLYTPMAAWLAQAFPDLTAFIDLDGRMAVQPFLVIGGFLAAYSLHRRNDYPVAQLIFQRYLRLAPPLALALLMVIGFTSLMENELSKEEWVSPLPSIGIFVAHLFFLQDILGLPSLSAGAWYVAIDLQLFSLLVLMAHVCSRFKKLLADSLAPAILAVATLLSIVFFCRNPALDIWAIYFLSAYGLGALAAWAGLSSSARIWWWITVAALVVDWMFDTRDRPVWALTTAFMLYWGAHINWSASPNLVGRCLRHLSAVSYGVFVCHFAVIVLISGLWLRFDLQGLSWALVGTALVCLLSLGLGGLVQSAGGALIAALRRGEPIKITQA